jgi:hypothetical protein
MREGPEIDFLALCLSISQTRSKVDLAPCKYDWREFPGNYENLQPLPRIYDREGQGFITMDTLRGLIAELLAPLTEEELDGIIEELDEDGSGTMDFDEFCEMMMSAPQN